MIALMEQAADELLAGCIGVDEASVGTLMNVKHLSASPIGRKITAKAKVDYVFGRKVEFTVTAHDGVNEIGTGKHERVIIGIEKFMSKIGI